MLARGDVAPDHGRADHGAGGIADRREREGHVDAAARPRHMHDLELLEALALPDLLGDLGHFVLALGRDEQRDGSPADLGLVFSSFFVGYAIIFNSGSRSK